MKQILKQLFTCFALLISISVFSNPYQQADVIVGTWVNASGKGHIQIYKQGDKYYGKLVWLKEPN